jgi:ferredoxin
MTIKQRKQLASIVGICWVLSILWGCQQETQTTQPTTTIKTTEPAENAEIQTDTTTIDETNIQTQQLVINPGCIGCGRCMQTAPSNFTMGGRHAQVISQNNLDSSAVQQAINNCPVQVIELIEV